MLESIFDTFLIHYLHRFDDYCFTVEYTGKPTLLVKANRTSTWSSTKTFRKRN